MPNPEQLRPPKDLTPEEIKAAQYAAELLADYELEDYGDWILEMRGEVGTVRDGLVRCEEHIENMPTDAVKQWVMEQAVPPQDASTDT